MLHNLRISLIQTALVWEDAAANRNQLQACIAALPPTDVVVLPEMFSTGFSMRPDVLAEPMDGPTVQWMQHMARQHRVVLTGSCMIKEGDAYYNRLIWMLPTGDYGYYDKRHLFAYAGEQQHYTAGAKRLIGSVRGWRVLLLTCYDLRFPVWSRQHVQQGEAEYDAIVYVANWPERRSHAWKSLLVARAIENQCYVAGLNRVGHDGNGIAHSGDSMLINPLGEVLWHCAHQEASYTATLNQEHLQDVRTRFPFLADADGFTIMP